MSWTIEHDRMKDSQHYNGKKGSLSCGMRIRLKAHEISGSKKEEFIELTGIHSRGDMTNLGLVLDANAIPELIEALQDIQRARRVASVDVYKDLMKYLDTQSHLQRKVDPYYISCELEKINK